MVGVDVAGSASFDPSLDELALLATSAGDEPVARVTARRRSPDQDFGLEQVVPGLGLGRMPHHADAILARGAADPGEFGKITQDRINFS